MGQKNRLELPLRISGAGVIPRGVFRPWPLLPIWVTLSPRFFTIQAEKCNPNSWFATTMTNAGADAVSIYQESHNCYGFAVPVRAKSPTCRKVQFTIHGLRPSNRGSETQEILRKAGRQVRDLPRTRTTEPVTRSKKHQYPGLAPTVSLRCYHNCRVGGPANLRRKLTVGVTTKHTAGRLSPRRCACLERRGRLSTCRFAVLLGSAGILFVERLPQVVKIGIECYEARCSLKEGLPACVIRQTIK